MTKFNFYTRSFLIKNPFSPLDLLVQHRQQADFPILSGEKLISNISLNLGRDNCCYQKLSLFHHHLNAFSLDHFNPFIHLDWTLPLHQFRGGLFILV